MIKTAVLAALLGATIYVAVFVDLGGKSLAAHVHDVWQTPVVQHKVAAITEDVREKIDTKVSKTATEAKKAVASKTPALVDEITDDDRALLSQTLEKASSKN